MQSFEQKCEDKYEIIERYEYKEECSEKVEEVCKEEIKIPVPVKVPYPVPTPVPEYHEVEINILFQCLFLSQFFFFLLLFFLGKDTYFNISPTHTFLNLQPINYAFISPDNVTSSSYSNTRISPNYINLPPPNDTSLSSPNYTCLSSPNYSYIPSSNFSCIPPSNYSYLPSNYSSLPSNNNISGISFTQRCNTTWASSPTQ